jgi:hypothetical protein
MVDVHRVHEERSTHACFFGTPRREPTPPMGLASLVDGHAIWKKQWSIQRFED